MDDCIFFPKTVAELIKWLNKLPKGCKVSNSFFDRTLVVSYVKESNEISGNY